MSWCRWSTVIDGKKQSDLYIYDSVSDCITVHIAGRRRINFADNPYKWINPKELVGATNEQINEFVQNEKNRSEWMEKNTIWEDLPEEYAGKTYDFSYDDTDSLTEFLHQAETDGINFPDYIFEYTKEYKHE
jgi:hypothetical protein